MAYDATRQRVVLSGGSDNSRFLAGTWEWDGVSWTLTRPCSDPAGVMVRSSPRTSS